jgi:hypothetical protein
MATSRWAVAVLLCIAAAPVAAAAPATVPTSTPAAGPAEPPASEPWWLPFGFQGHAVRDVRADAGQVTVTVDGLGTRQSNDFGGTWHAAADPLAVAAPPPGEWQVRGGRVGRVDAAGTWRADPGSPRMGQPPAAAGHSRIAVLPGHDGLVVAVDAGNVVWRRGGDGGWARALLLLPQDVFSGPPSVTGSAAFDQPLSDAVYLATDGYSVLLSTDGGDDWVRAGPGLPDRVLAIATDSPRRAVLAATADGVWLHHLRATPKPPVYGDENLRQRLLGIVAVCAVAVLLSIAGMLRLSRPA